MRTVGNVMQCLKKYGQRLDSEIATEMGLPIATVRQRLNELAATREIVLCSVTRLQNGKTFQGFECRVSGYVPSPAPGRKAKAAA
jgi:hypothetical protein